MKNNTLEYYVGRCKLLDLALQYVDDVLNEKEISTWEVKQTCENFVKDLQQMKNEDYEYIFKVCKVKKIDAILQLINFGDGVDEDGNEIKGKCFLDGCAGFQAFLLVSIFGWRQKRNLLKMRYRDVVLYIARKNAKTFIVSLIFILLMLTEPDYSEFYSICVSKDLASTLKKEMGKIISESPDIADYFVVSKTFTGKITCTLTHSFFEPRVANANTNNSISGFVEYKLGKNGTI